MFALRLNEILKWIDNDSARLDDPSALRDGFRAHIVRLTRDFLAFPHCENFALMPDHEQTGDKGDAHLKKRRPVETGAKRARGAPALDVVDHEEEEEEGGGV